MPPSLPMPPVAYVPEHGWLIDEHLLEEDYRAARDLLTNDYAQDFKDACAALDAAHLVHLNTALPPGLEVGEDTEFGGFMYRCMGGECKRSGAHDSPGGAAMYATMHRQSSECRHTVHEPRRYVLTVVRGAQPDANGEELGLSDLAHTALFAGVRSWLKEHEAWENPGSDVWVLVTPAEEDPGDLTGVLAQRTVKLGVDLV